MSSLDEKERSLAKTSVGCTPLTALLTFAVVGISILFGLLLMKLNNELTTLQMTVVKLHSDVVGVHERLQSTDEIKKQVDDTLLLEYADHRVKRSATASSKPSESTVNVGQAFASLIKQLCKPEAAICIAGQPGRDGKDGLPGSIGLPGLPGRDGSVGLPGQPGRDGKDGLLGRDGRIGLPGPAGKDGKAGRNGEAGSKGSAGKQGPRGIAGMKGDMGPNGEKGEKGDKGERGVGGLQGISGPRGEKGNEGEKGERGEIGYKGEKGGKGEIGLQGEKGIKEDTGMKGNKGNEQDLRPLMGTPSQCLPENHRMLNETWRQTSERTSKTSHHCDRTGHSSNQHGFTPGWYSFSPTIGGSMPEKCTSPYYCGTIASGWLNGSHPNVIGQNVSRTVCFSWRGTCCFIQTSVEVINCGLYYIYNLPNVPLCQLGYCARGQ